MVLAQKVGLLILEDTSIARVIKIWRVVFCELVKPCDEGIGGPLGLDGCSLRWPEMVSRSYMVGEIKLK